MSSTKQIFFSYSDYQQDRELYSKINRHFSLYVRNNFVSIIDKEEVFKRSADKQIAFELLKNSDIAVPLLSVDFLTNDDCLKLLLSAVCERKTIIPILLRDVDIESENSLSGLKKNILPVDGKSILHHFNELEDDDEILTIVTKKIKAIAFKELDDVRVISRSKLFYYILAGVVMGMGACASVFVYNSIINNKLWVSIFVLLLFTCIALFALKNVLFPTEIKKL